MKKNFLPALLACPLLLVSCATSPTAQRQTYHVTDVDALVVKSVDRQNSQMLQPAATEPTHNETVLSKAHALPKRQTAVVILENYTERQIGNDFRDRGTEWFVCLRNLGYQHIVFLQGNGLNNPEGLPTIAKYD
jgi:hypothetical protein